MDEPDIATFLMPMTPMKNVGTLAVKETLAVIVVPVLVTVTVGVRLVYPVVVVRFALKKFVAKVAPPETAPLLVMLVAVVTGDELRDTAARLAWSAAACSLVLTIAAIE